MAPTPGPTVTQNAAAAGIVQSGMMAGLSLVSTLDRLLPQERTKVWRGIALNNLPLSLTMDELVQQEEALSVMTEEDLP